ncbi:hypothetical protein ACYSNW_15520, partial [Enterococcus sp. LJL99]
MRKFNKLKKKIAGLLVIVSIAIILLMIFAFSLKNNILDAKEQNQDKVMIKVNDIPITEEILEIDGNQADVELSTKKNNWVKIPLEKGFSISRVLENEQESGLPALASDDFNIKDEVEKLENSEQKSDTIDQNKSEINKVDSSNDFTSIAFQTIEKNKDVVYIRLITGQPLKLKINRKNSSESTVKLVYLDGKHSSDTILKLAYDEQFLEPITPLSEEETANDQPEEFTTDEISDELVPDIFEADSRAISVSNPFKVSVDIDRLTGVAPFDTTDEPGYDSSPNNDRVRTFDSVNYTLRAGISINTSTYKSLRVRVDTKVNGAWRLDSAGKVRQTAELLNGTLVNAASNGTKNSTHSTWVNVEATSGQIFVTETLNTYGGVNNDELNPEFVLTIESAVTNTGSTVSINQVIDKSVSPNMSDKVYLSAKPYVDVKLTINSTKATFDKTSGTNDKPNSMVASTAAYVQLKPLPGRADITSMKGVTYPVGGIKYKIKQKIYYKENETAGLKQLKIGQETQPVEVIAFDGLTAYTMPNPKFTSQFQSYANNYKPVDRQGTAAPAGYTNKVYPTPWTERPSYYNMVGIYNTGNPVVTNNKTDYEIEVENNDYAPIDVGPNKYLVSGSKMSPNDKPFSVVAMQTLFPYQYLEDRVGVNASLEYFFSVDEINYEDKEQTINSTMNYSWARKWPGTFETYTLFVDKYNTGLSTADIGTKNWGSIGDGSITQGDTLKIRFWTNIKNPLADKNVFYGRWNANSFAYDTSRVFSATTGNITYFGVSKTNNNFPDVSLRSQSDLENAFNWFDNPSQALKTGAISAVKCESNITSPDGKSTPGIYVPVKNISPIGVNDNSGNPNIALTNAFLLKKDNTLMDMFPKTAHKNYEETKYNKDGKLVSYHSPSPSWGDTLYIRGILIRPTIAADKTNYNPTEKITWTAKGSVTSGSDQNHKVQLDVTIPKETTYEFGSATNHKGESLPNPTITENSDGTKTLCFIQDYLVAGNYNPTVNFKTSIISSALNFTNNQATLSAKVVSQVWLENDSSVTDTSSVAQRTSNTSVTVSNAGVIVIDKVTDAPFIESGNAMDPANQDEKNPTDISFTISYKNHSTGSLGNVRALDVLPYNGDGRGTQYSGSYNVINATTLVGKGDLWYTNMSVSVELDPNSVNLSDGKWKKLGNDQSVLS